MTTKQNELQQRAAELKLFGLLSHWQEVEQSGWPETLINWEETERTQRSLQRRLESAKLGRFKHLSEFDWSWSEDSHREVIEEWMTLNFMTDVTNLILCGPNGVGKSTLACNIGYQAVIQGHTALFITAAKMLGDLAAQEGDSALQRRMKYYVNPSCLIVDELGYLSYSNRHADLLFEIITRRYEEKPTIITTNKSFAEWKDIFPNAACVVSIIDRLVHHSDIINIKAESFRFKEAKEKNQTRQAKRNKSKSNTTPKTLTENHHEH